MNILNDGLRQKISAGDFYGAALYDIIKKEYYQSLFSISE